MFLRLDISTASELHCDVVLHDIMSQSDSNSNALCIYRRLIEHSKNHCAKSSWYNYKLKMTTSLLICLTFMTFHFAEITYCAHIAPKTKPVIGGGESATLTCLFESSSSHVLLFWGRLIPRQAIEFPFMGTRTASPRGRYGERPQRDSV